MGRCSNIDLRYKSINQIKRQTSGGEVQQLFFNINKFSKPAVIED